MVGLEKILRERALSAKSTRTLRDGSWLSAQITVMGMNTVITNWTGNVSHLNTTRKHVTICNDGILHLFATFILLACIRSLTARVRSLGQV